MVKSSKIKKNSLSRKLNKIDQLILRLDTIENAVKNAPKRANESIKKFIKNNMYILILITSIILAGIGYRAYTFSKKAGQSTLQVTNTIDKIYKIIDTDDSLLNESQKLVKYLYLTTVNINPTENEKQKFKQAYDNITNKGLSDIYSKGEPILLNQLIPTVRNQGLKIVDEDLIPRGKTFISNDLVPKLNEGILNYTKNTVGNLSSAVKSSVDTGVSAGSAVITSIGSTIGYLFGSSSKIQFDKAKYEKNPDIFVKCYNSISSSSKITSFDSFISNLDLSKELFDSNIDTCYNKVSDLANQFNKYTLGEIDICAKNIQNIDDESINTDLLTFLIQFYTNPEKIKQFSDCLKG